MVEFKDRLEELLKDNNLNAEQLSTKLNKDLSPNTIRNYKKGNTSPKSMKEIEILANFFNVSTDYIQGFTDVPTNNVEIKTICNKYGLSEKALKNLELLNNQKKAFSKDLKTIGLSITHIETINKLIEEFSAQNHDNALLSLIDLYLNLEIKDNEFISISSNGELKKVDIKKDRYGGVAIINNKVIINGILDFIDNRLIEMRKSNEKEGENK